MAASRRAPMTKPVRVALRALIALAIATPLARQFVRAPKFGRAKPNAPKSVAPAGDPAAPASEDATRALMATELRRAKEAAEAANEAKTRYLVAVSHEIRSPLNAIYGYAQLLERDGGICPVEAGGVIRRAAEHLTNLVEGLVEISRIESGILEVTPEVVQLPSLLEHVMDMFRMQAKAKGITLHYEEKGRVPRFVRTDEKRLTQILINLLSNAIKYTAQGRVTLSVSYRSQVAELDVCDTGIGIAPEDLELIFNPFERGSSPQAALQPGLGLGLAITRALSRILGGEVIATSLPGVGSRFRFRIFLPEPFTPPAQPADYRQLVGYQGPRRTILVVDDQLSQLNILDSLLRRLDFTVYAAGNGAEGLALAERCRPDLVLLDIHMPGISGWDVAARLRTAYGDAIRIIMVSANAYEAPVTGEGATHHDAFVTKPVDLKKLLAVIGRELKLSWDLAGDHPRAPAPQPQLQVLAPVLPAEAGAAFRQIRQLAEAGDIRAVEAALNALETDLPASAEVVVVMREYVGNFDLRSVIKLLNGYQSS